MTKMLAGRGVFVMQGAPAPRRMGRKGVYSGHRVRSASPSPTRDGGRGDGERFAADHDRKLAVHFVASLRRIADAYPDGPPYLAMDNVTMHDAKVVRAWRAANPRACIVWLPKYAAHDANPVERIRGLMKDAVAANCVAGSSEELTATAHRFFADLAAHPVALPLAA